MAEAASNENRSKSRTRSKSRNRNGKRKHRNRLDQDGNGNATSSGTNVRIENGDAREENERLLSNGGDLEASVETLDSRTSFSTQDSRDDDHLRNSTDLEQQR